MDNPVDHTIIDLGFVNYVQHPTNPNYIVYRFADINRANSFEEALKEQSIWFEKDSEQKRSKEYFLFGIHKRDYKKTEKINYSVEAKHKKPFIPTKFLRYGLMLFSATVMLLAIIGYCKQQNKLSRINETGQLINNEKLSE
ncbi:MAG: hypothetical protein COA33_000085 [Fluviicola sp.]|nr:hypothetical protein [Fluviicola sp.]